MIRTSILNGIITEYDKDYSSFWLFSLTQGVIEGLEVQAGKVLKGVWFIKVVRTSTTPEEEILIRVENTEDLTIDTTGTKKVWLEVKQININDAGENLPDGSNVTEIKTGADYPTKNFIPLADIVAGVITDKREFIRTKEEIELRGNLIPKAKVLTKNDNYAFTGTEQNNTTILVDTSEGDITIDLNPSLFDNSLGLLEFTIIKNTSDANTVIIDAGTDNTIDTEQTYILSNNLELVKLTVISSTKLKVLNQVNKTQESVASQNLISTQKASENITALNVVWFKKINVALNKTVTGTWHYNQVSSSGGTLWQEITMSEPFLLQKVWLISGWNSWSYTCDVKDATGTTTYFSSASASWPAGNTHIETIFSNATILPAWTYRLYYNLPAYARMYYRTGESWIFTSSSAGASYSYGLDVYYIYKGLYNSDNANPIIDGVAKNSWNTKESIDIITEGIISGFSWLLTSNNIWDPVYLQDDASIDVTPWSNTIVVWKIFSDTEIEFINKLIWEISTTATTGSVSLWNAVWYIEQNIAGIGIVKIPYYNI